MNLLIINPVSGTGSHQNAIRIVEQRINRKYLDQYTSEHRDDIARFIESYNISELENILILGGDGTISEVIQGLLQNDQWNESKPAIIPLGGGSGNGLAVSLLSSRYLNLTTENALELLRYEKKKLDIGNCRIDGTTSIPSFLSVTYGFVSDLDIETEWLRFIGSFRFTLGAIWNLVWMRTYRLDLEYWDEDNQHHTIDRDVVMFLASNVSHIASDFLVSETIRPNDQVFHLKILPGGISRMRMANIMLSIESQGTDPYEEFITVRAKRFILRRSRDQGIVCIDGESVDCETLDCSVDESVTIRG